MSLSSFKDMKSSLIMKPAVNSDACELCEFVVHYVDNALRNNATDVSVAV